VQPATSTLFASPARTADRHAGNAKARSSGYSFLGGIGIGNYNWPVGAFAGYFAGRQRSRSAARDLADTVTVTLHRR